MTFVLAFPFPVVKPVHKDRPCSYTISTNLLHLINAYLVNSLRIELSYPVLQTGAMTTLAHYPLARLRGLEPPTSTFAKLRSIPTELQAYRDMFRDIVSR